MCQPHLPVVRWGEWNEFPLNFFPIQSIANRAPLFLQVATMGRCGRRLINSFMHEATMARCGRRFILHCGCTRRLWPCVDVALVSILPLLGRCEYLQPCVKRVQNKKKRLQSRSKQRRRKALTHVPSMSKQHRRKALTHVPMRSKQTRRNALTH